MINSYLGNICPFPLETRNVKEELNICPQHQIRLTVGPSNMAAIGVIVRIICISNIVKYLKKETVGVRFRFGESWCEVPFHNISILKPVFH
jgi:hypothetical protein